MSCEGEAFLDERVAISVVVVTSTEVEHLAFSKFVGVNEVGDDGVDTGSVVFNSTGDGVIGVNDRFDEDRSCGITFGADEHRVEVGVNIRSNHLA